MKKRLKRSTQQYIVVSLLSVMIIGGAFILIYLTMIRNIKRDYQNEIKLLTEQLESREVNVYEAKKDILVGSIVTKDSLNYVQAYSNQSQDYYMSEDDVGMVALIDIVQGTQVLKGMLTQDIVDNNVREVEYNTFLLNSNMKENDFVDVRIMFQNGEDYIVLSKKSIKNISLEVNNCFLWLTEEEILNMSGAIVDAYMYTGTKFYTTKYVEPNLQEASIPTYQPSLSSLILMEQDENIVDRASKEINKQLRKRLENRLAVHFIPLAIDVSDVEFTVPEENQETENYFIQDETQDVEDVVEYGG